MTKKQIYKITLLFFALLSLFIAAMAEAGTITSSNNTGTMSITLTINPKVSFNANGGSGSMNAQVVSYDTATALTANAFIRTGYTFNSWNTLANGTGTNYADGASITLTADITLYAQWTAINYAISYELDGGTNNTANPANYTITSPDITLKTPTKTGYTFANWTSGDTAITLIPKNSTGNINLKANWTANTYTVKFNGNGGTGSMNDLTFTYGVEQALSNNAFTRTGYTFNGWKDNENNKTYNSGASVKNLTAVNGATITLYAQWKVNQYTLTFNTDGGSEISAITQDYGTDITAPADPTKEGYTFNGWDKEIPSTMPAENLTFTAQWKENEKSEDSTDEKSESKTADAERVSSMDNEELKQTFENKTEITLTGTISNESLSSVIEKITTVTEVKTLDLSKLENVTEVKLSDTVKVESLTVSGNEKITKVEVQNNSSLKSINLSKSKVETIDVNGCSELKEVVLTSCDNLQKLDVSRTPITKLDASNCEKLSSINCSSCDISELKIDGCKQLSDLNCANNSLTRLDVSSFLLNSLECEHQRIKGFRKKSSFNILDILFRKIAAFITSDENDEDTAELVKVKDITGVDENGNEISPSSYDNETGEVTFSKTPEVIKYNYETGFENTVMDVIVETSGESQGEENNDSSAVGGSGGGCDLIRNSKFGMRNFLIFFLIFALTFMKRRII